MIAFGWFWVGIIINHGNRLFQASTPSNVRNLSDVIHLNETKQLFLKKKDEYIAKVKGWIVPTVEKLIQKWEKLTGKKKQKKDTANVGKEQETMDHAE